jgi:surface protein
VVKIFLTNPANCVIDWGDGTSNTYSESGFNAFVSHTYATFGTATITITGYTESVTSPGGATGVGFGRNTSTYLTGIQSFGEIGLKHIIGIASNTGVRSYNTVGFTKIAPRLPNTVTDISYAFYSITSPNIVNNSTFAPVVNWNTSNVEYMVSTFARCTSFNQNISGWNTSEVKDMSFLFDFANQFNQPIGSWDVSNVEFMTGTFYEADAFNQPLNSWNVGNVKNMAFMFAQMSLFNQPLNNWNTSSVNTTSTSTKAEAGYEAYTGMNGMFVNNLVFDQDISMWVVTNIPTKPQFFDATNNTPPITNTNWTTAEKPNWGV